MSDSTREKLIDTLGTVLNRLLPDSIGVYVTDDPQSNGIEVMFATTVYSTHKIPAELANRPIDDNDLDGWVNWMSANSCAALFDMALEIDKMHAELHGGNPHPER